MNIEAVYGASAAQTLSLSGAKSIKLASLLALPPATSPLDSEKSIKAEAKAKQASSSGFESPIVGLILLIAALWMVMKL